MSPAHGVASLQETWNWRKMEDDNNKKAFTRLMHEARIQGLKKEVWGREYTVQKEGHTKHYMGKLNAWISKGDHSLPPDPPPDPPPVPPPTSATCTCTSSPQPAPCTHPFHPPPAPTAHAPIPCIHPLHPPNAIYMYLENSKAKQSLLHQPFVVQCTCT